MPWQEQSRMSLRQEFVTLALQGEVSVRELCRRFGISPPTGYKWLRRYQAAGRTGLADHSRRPHTSPARTPAALEACIVAVRHAHPAWGGRKIRAWLQAQGDDTVPSASTITAILRRHDLLDPDESAKHTAWQRFEHPQPNDLWQLDFKGHFPLAQGRCHPLSVLDDHSRFALGLVACGNEQDQTVRTHLTSLFRRYGLPWRILTDNSGPWGSTQAEQPLTAFSVWLIRLGIAVSHGRHFHPQTQGKVERFHRTLKAELLRDTAYATVTDAQQSFDTWRQTYNHERPHEALALAVPASRYQVSPRPFPETLPPLEYAPGETVGTVRRNGQLHYQHHDYYISLALADQPVAVRPTLVDGILAVQFAHQHMGTLDVHTHRFTMTYGRPVEV